MINMMIHTDVAIILSLKALVVDNIDKGRMVGYYFYVIYYMEIIMSYIVGREFWGNLKRNYYIII